MRIRSAREHVLVEAVDEFVRGIGQVARYFLFDGSPFLRPLLLRVVNPMHASGLDLESNVKIRCWNRGKILGNVLLRIGVVLAPELRINGRRLVCRQPCASAKRHVLLRMGHAGKPWRRLIAAHQEIYFHRNTEASVLQRMTTRMPLGRVARTAFV